ncbi:hypothetical protein V8C42DRAFT_326704 [Trichoderma barbatum]
MTEKLILHLHYECVRHKVNIPWDAIAHRLRPGSSGAAVLQHVNRLRKELLSEGHMVPPPAQKASPSTPFDPTIRGYVRDPTSDDKFTTRPVGFDEKLDDAKVNLPDAFDALEEGDDEDFTEADADVTVIEDEIQLPITPTPVRHAAPRRPVSAPHCNMMKQESLQGSGEAAQQLFDSNLFADISPPNFLLNNTVVSSLSYQGHRLTSYTNKEQGLQPMGIQNPTTFANEAQLLVGGGSLFDPFTPQPLIKSSHEQISPGGQVPLGQGQQPYFMGNPFFPYTGYYNMAQPGFMSHPPYGFSMPPSPPAAIKVEEKREPFSSPVAIKERGISVSPVSSPIGAQLPTSQPETLQLQPVVESPEQQLDELTVSNSPSSTSSPTVIKQEKTND